MQLREAREGTKGLGGVGTRKTRINEKEKIIQQDSKPQETRSFSKCLICPERMRKAHSGKADLKNFISLILFRFRTRSIKVQLAHWIAADVFNL